MSWNGPGRREDAEIVDMRIHQAIRDLKAVIVTAADARIVMTALKRTVEDEKAVSAMLIFAQFVQDTWGES